jgi:hypothetical protein
LKGKIIVRIIDLNGKVIKELVTDKLEYDFKYDFSLRNLAKGLYNAEVIVNNQIDHALFIVK